MRSQSGIVADEEKGYEVQAGIRADAASGSIAASLRSPASQVELAYEVKGAFHAVASMMAAMFDTGRREDGMAVEFKPEGYQTVTPYLVVDGAADLIDFMKQVLGAEETLRLPRPDGRIGHAELRTGDSLVMLADTPDGETMPAMLHLYLEDADATYQRALDAGAISVRELKTEFYGDRMGGVEDRFGNKWYFATHVEDVDPEVLGLWSGR